MKRRILVAILAVTAAAVLLFAIPLTIVVGRFVDNDATLRVEREAVLAARSVPGDFATSGDPVELPTSRDGIVLGLYDIAGTLVAGHGPATADASTTSAMGNHVVAHESGDARVVAVPITGGETVVGAIRAEQSTGSSSARFRRIALLIAALGVGVLAIAAAIGTLLANRLARPVRRLSDAAIRLGDGDFTVTVPPSRVPELDDAGRAMNTTARRLDDLLTRARSFGTDASHQLRTPLAGLRTSIETELTFPRADPNEALRDALVDIDRLERTITELLALARTSNVASSTTALDVVLTDLRSAWHGALASQGRALRIDAATACPPVIGNATVLRHALDVLLDNAVHHGAGQVGVDVALGPDTITISVSDEGPGFDVPAPMSVTGDGRVGHDEAAARHGLGLPLARRLVEAMPGRLTIAHPGRHPRIDVVLTIAPGAE